MRTLREQIGENVRAVRGQRTMQAMGDSLKPFLGRAWSRQAVWDAENGRRDFTAAELLALAAALDTTVPQLLASDEPVELPSGQSISPEVLDALTAPFNADRDRWLTVARELRGMRRFAQNMRLAVATNAVQLARLEAAAQGRDPRGDVDTVVANFRDALWRVAADKADEWASREDVTFASLDREGEK